MTEPTEDTGGTLRARLAGAILQGIVLGIFLVPALIELASLAGGIAPFKYQGF